MVDSRMTPIDIESEMKQLKRVVRGYSCSQVETLIKTFIKDYESVLLEVANARNELELAKNELSRFHASENILKDAIILAQRNADETRTNAHKEADLIVEEARQKALLTEQEAKHTVAWLQQDMERLRNERINFVIEFKGLLSAFLERIQRLENEPPDTPETATVLVETNVE
jgi:cell division initiation protein